MTNNHATACLVKKLRIMHEGFTDKLDQATNESPETEIFDFVNAYNLTEKTIDKLELMANDSNSNARLQLLDADETLIIKQWLIKGMGTGEVATTFWNILLCNSIWRQWLTQIIDDMKHDYLFVKTRDYSTTMPHDLDKFTVFPNKPINISELRTLHSYLYVDALFTDKPKRILQALDYQYDLHIDQAALITKGINIL